MQSIGCKTYIQHMYIYAVEISRCANVSLFVRYGCLSPSTDLHFYIYSVAVKGQGLGEDEMKWCQLSAYVADLSQINGV